MSRPWGSISPGNGLSWHGIVPMPGDPPIPEGTPVWQAGEAMSAFRAWEAGLPAHPDDQGFASIRRNRNTKEQ